MAEPIFAILNISSQTVTNAGLDFQIEILKGTNPSGMPEIEYDVGNDLISSTLELDRWQPLEVVQGGGCQDSVWLARLSRTAPAPAWVPAQYLRLLTGTRTIWLRRSDSPPISRKYSHTTPGVTKDADLCLEQKWRLQ